MNKFKQWGLYLYKRALTELARLAQTPAGVAKLKIEKKYRIEAGHPGKITILLVGVGGTGGYVAHSLAQFAVWARGQGIDTRIYFVDPDSVEDKNLARQNFCRAEVGYPKAFTLAWRYNAAFGLNITPVVQRFSGEMLKEYSPAATQDGTGRVMLVIGAVDNVQARRDIATAIEAHIKTKEPGYSVWWLDSGNERATGQVLIGNSLEKEPLLSPMGICAGTPLPHIQEPSLLAERPPAQETLECAELGLLEEQGAMINRMMANWVGVYLHQLLQSRDLKTMATWVDLSGGRVSSTYVTQGKLLMLSRDSARNPRPRPPADTDTITDVECPACGDYPLVEGDDWYNGVLVRVCFCTHCTYREESCPECGGEISEDTRVNHRGEPVPVLRCEECRWQHDANPAP